MTDAVQAYFGGLCNFLLVMSAQLLVRDFCPKQLVL